MGPVWLEEALAPYGLAIFAQFIAWSEAVIGLLLLSKTTRVLGAVMMVPLLLNILMVTISMQWRGTPWVILIFVSTNAFLLAFHYQRWRPIFNYALTGLFGKNVTNRQVRVAGMVFIMMVLSGPFLFQLNKTISVVVIVFGFLGIAFGEYNLRYVGPFESTASDED